MEFDRVSTGWQFVCQADVEIGPYTRIGHGVIINAGARIGQNVRIGDGVIITGVCAIGDFVDIRAGSVISKGVEIKPHAFIAAGVMTGSTANPATLKRVKTVIGAGAMVGLGAILAPGIWIEAGCQVGAGSVVVEPVLCAHGVPMYYCGNPAKPRRAVRDHERIKMADSLQTGNAPFVDWAAWLKYEI